MNEEKKPRAGKLTGREKMYGQQKPEKQGKQSLCPRRNRRGMMT
jgi:hypothetical protein